MTACQALEGGTLFWRKNSLLWKNIVMALFDRIEVFKMHGLVSSFQAINESVSHDFLFASLGPQYLSFSHLVRYVFFSKYVDHLNRVWIVYNPIVIIPLELVLKM